MAAGRLFTGDAAIKAGLVDKIGTLNDTVLAAAKDAGIDKNYQIFVYPEPKTIVDLIREGFMADASLPPEFKAALKAAPAAYRQEMNRMIEMVRCMQSERVMMALPGLVEGK